MSEQSDKILEALVTARACVGGAARNLKEFPIADTALQTDIIEYAARVEDEINELYSAIVAGGPLRPVGL